MRYTTPSSQGLGRSMTLQPSTMIIHMLYLGFHEYFSTIRLMCVSPCLAHQVLSIRALHTNRRRDYNSKGMHTGYQKTITTGPKSGYHWLQEHYSISASSSLSPLPNSQLFPILPAMFPISTTSWCLAKLHGHDNSLLFL